MALVKKIEERPAFKRPGQATDEKKLAVSNHLKTADKCIREGKTEQARAELQKVHELEPNNAYAFAFQERIIALEKEKSKPAESAEQKAQSPAEASKTKVEERSAPVHTATEPPKDSAPPPPVFDEKKLDEEKARLEIEAKKEQEAFEEQSDKTHQLKLQEELLKADISYREKLELEKQQIEKEIRIELEAQASVKLKELQDELESERAEFAEKEKKIIELTKMQLEAEHAKQLTVELENLKKSATAEDKESRKKLEETLKDQLQKEFEMKLAQERSSLEEQNHKKIKDVEKEHKDRHDFFVKENEKASEERIREAKLKEAEKFEQKKSELQKSLEIDFQTKLQKAITDEQKKSQQHAKEAVEVEQAKFNQERQKFQQEYATLQESLKQMKSPEAIAQDIETAKQEASQMYERRLTLLGLTIPENKEDRLALYADRIRIAWSDGTITMEEAQGLMELQELLDISFDEHATCEANVRLQLYANAVEQAILSGKLQASNAQALDELKIRYEITVEEEARLEPLILSAFQRSATKATILVADDDIDLSNFIKDRLLELGYNAIVENSVTQALEFVQKNPVDLILSDLRYQGEKMDGFTFFKELQKDAKLKKIPFIVMTSMDEGLFMRTGVQLGIDDYLTKPLDLELLTAVVEGKLRRYRMLKEN